MKPTALLVALLLSFPAFAQYTSTAGRNAPAVIHLYGSDGKVVGAYYDRDGKRAILDGGYTRLYLKWDTAGTGRYVKNAAAWLTNAERFGDDVVAVRKPADRAR